MMLDNIKSANKLINMKTERNEINKNIQDFSEVNKKLNIISKSLSNYTTSLNTLNLINSDDFPKVKLDVIRNSINKIEKELGNDYINNTELLNLSDEIRKLEIALKEKWYYHYKLITSPLIKTILSIENLVDDKYQLQSLLSSLDPDKLYWPIHMNSINIINTNIDKGKSIISELGLNDEIEKFLTKISNNEATIFDLSPEILRWIKKKDLEDKIKLVFK